jgi:hypothetical protein
MKSRILMALLALLGVMHGQAAINNGGASISGTSDTQVLFNSSGVITGSAGLTFDTSTRKFTLTAGATTGANNIWTVTDTATNTGTGFLGYFSTTGLSMNGVRVDLPTSSTGYYLQCRLNSVQKCLIDSAGNATFGSITFSGTFTLNGATSGSVSEQAPAVALGNYTITRTADPHDPSMFAMYDEFAGGNTTNGSIGQLGWVSTTIGGAPTYSGQSGVYPNLGVFRIATPAVAAQGGTLSPANVAGTTGSLGNLGGNTNWDFVFIVKLGQTANNRIRIGACSDATVVEASNGIWFRTDQNATYADGAFWKVIARSGSVNTTGGTTYASDTTAWHKLRIRSTTAGTVIFTFDSNADQSIASGVPTANLSPCIVYTNDTTASTGTLDIDYFRVMLTGLSR